MSVSSLPRTPAHPPEELSLKGCESTLMRPETSHAIHEIEVEVRPKPGGRAKVVFGYQSARVSGTAVAAVVESYRKILRLLAEKHHADG
jgi:hypothetical protein